MSRRFFRDFSNEPRMFRQMLFRNLLLYTLIIMFFLGGFLIFVEEVTVRGIEKEVKASVQRVERNFERLLDDITVAAINLGNDVNLQSLEEDSVPELDFDRIDPTRLYALQNHLVGVGATLKMAKSVAVYIYETDYVVADNGTILLDSFYRSIFGIDTNPESVYVRRITPGRILFIPPGGEESGNSRTHQVCVTGIRDRHGNRMGNLFVFLEETVIDAAIREEIGEDYEYVIWDDQSNRLFGTLQPETDEKRGEFYGFAQDERENYSCSVGMGQANGAKLLGRNRIAVLAFFLAVLAGGWYIVYKMSRSSYEPIKELTSIVKEKQEGDEDETILEYETLKEIISSIFSDRHLLREQIMVYKPILVNSLLQELLYPYSSKETILQRLEELGVHILGPYYRCVCIRTNGRPCTLPLECREFGVVYDAHHTVVLLNARQQEELERAEKALMEWLDMEEEEPAVGIGETVTGADRIPTSADQARRSIDYVEVEGRKNRYRWKDILRSGAMDTIRPGELKSLYPALCAGRTEEVRRSLSEYFDRAFQKDYVKREYLVYLQETMVSAIEKLGRENEVDCPSLFLMREKWQAYSPEAAVYLRELCSRVLEELERVQRQWEAEREKKGDTELLLYMEEHLLDENFSLKMLSDHFQVSESVISRRVKKAVGSSFVHYTNERRIHKACALLRSERVQINEIARKTGYGSDITFRRVFKKYMGITPNEYRFQALQKMNVAQKKDGCPTRSDSV